jgi:hypothetical protein
MKPKQFVASLLAGSIFAGVAAVVYSATQEGFGYKGTPQIPGTKWGVHDGDRPQPRVVTSGAAFSHMAPPPSDAIVLFDGKDLSKWQSARGGDAKWKVENDCMETAHGLGNIRTKDKFPDFQMHLEFATPTPAQGTGQGRGNSGVLINGMYEVQVLDSFEAKTYPDGQCGALYGQTPPLVNACKAPGEWQTYDIIFESPRWDENGTLTKKANVTVIHNGVVLHHKREYIGATDGIGGVPHLALGAYTKPHEPEVFIELQDHANPVRYRNIWIRPLGEYDKS